MSLHHSEREAFMQQALDQAVIRRGFCSPNPAVGAVLVRDGKLIATGTHWASGQAHAEVDAIKKAKGAAQGATLFVTLEPCCHWGKTPPCTKAIIEAGITVVYYGYLDPNPRVAGQGVKQLQQAGIQCEPCFLESVQDFYQSYAYWRVHARPWVTAKLAISCDNKIAGPDGVPVSITGKALQQLTHKYRKKHDAILTTVRTVINDDPRLNVRLEGEEHQKPIYILDTGLRMPLNAKLFNTARSLTVFHVAEASDSRRAALEAQGVRCVSVAKDGAGLSLLEVLKVIGKAGVHDLWVEAGGRCFSAFCQEGLLQRALIYVAPIVLGEEALDASICLKDLQSDAKSTRWRTYEEEAVCELLF